MKTNVYKTLRSDNFISSFAVTMNRKTFFVIFFYAFISITQPSHYRGGSFTWKPVRFLSNEYLKSLLIILRSILPYRLKIQWRFRLHNDMRGAEAPFIVIRQPSIMVVILDRAVCAVLEANVAR